MCDATHQEREQEERKVDWRVRRDVRDGAVLELVDPEAHERDQEEDGELQGHEDREEELATGGS
jgi:hypothetical protein